MALQTKTYSVQSSNGYTLRLTLTEDSIDSAANQSKGTYKLVLMSGAYDFAQYGVGAYIKFDGTTIASRDRYNSSQITLGTYSSVTLLSGSYTADHASNGSRTLNIAFGIDMASASYTPGPLSGTGKMDLTAIPRASSIGAADAYVGAVSSVVVTEKSNSYTHSIAYAFGSLSGYIQADGSTSNTEVKFSESTVAFVIPTAFYNQIPNAKTGTCKLTCKTYSGSTQIGDAQTASFTVRTDPAVCAPSLSGTVEDVNAATLALTGDASRFVRYFSNALCTITASAKNGASLKEKRIGGTAVSENTRTMSAIETNKIVFEATDSRGYTESLTKNIDLVAYIKLTNNAACTRDDATSGKATLKLTGNYFAGSFGSAANALTARYRIDGGDWITVSDITVSGGTYSATVALTGLDYQQTHTVDVQAFDKLMDVTKSLSVKKGIPQFDWGEHNFAFHVPVTNDTALGIGSGGTGAATAEEARLNLGAAEVDHKHGADDLNPGGLYTDWALLTLDSAFQEYNGNDSYKPRYKAYGNIVTVRGVVSPKSEFTSSTSLVTMASGLPEALRPKIQLSFIGQGSGFNRWQCIIGTDGTISLSRYGITAAAAVPTSAWLTFCCTYID